MANMWKLLRVLFLSTSVALVAGSGCSGKKPCPAGQEECLGSCRNFQDDPIACGSCGHVCPTGASCTAGACVCPQGTTECGNACVDLQTSTKNCGACSHDCGVGTCGSGTCDCGSFLTCAPGASPQCVDAQNDRRNCGACGHDCGVGTCSSGTCACAAFTNCNPGGVTSPQCRDTTADRLHCGSSTSPASCTTECSSNQICRTSACITCAAPTPNQCANSCTSLQTDAANCGTCGHVCTGAQVCSGGQCVCPSTKTVCLGACVDTQTDAANCGGCGKRCPTGQACAGGACACTSGLTCTGTCCTGGNGCCLAGCQVEHDTGQGQPTFFDCNAAGSHDAALAAAQHFDPAGALVTGQAGLTCNFSTECVAWLTSAAVTPQSCGVWCYAGNFAGKAVVTQSITCLCPDTTSVAWH